MAVTLQISAMNHFLTTHIHVVYSVSTDRSSVVAEVVLDGRNSHLKENNDTLRHRLNKNRTKILFDISTLNVSRDYNHGSDMVVTSVLRDLI